MTYEEEQVFTDKAIRDTSNHFSVVVDSKRFLKKSAIIHNGLNVDVDIRWQGSIDVGFTKPMSLEPLVTVSAGTEKLITTDDLIPFMRLRAKCSSSPSSGDVDAWIMGSQ